MLGNRCLGKTEALPDMLDIALPGAEAGHDLEPHRMPEDLENLRFISKDPALVEFHGQSPDNGVPVIFVYIGFIFAKVNYKLFNDKSSR